jgi:lysozyme family protein
MAEFKIAYDITMCHEGGYANNPKDTGGETWKGVARNKNPKWKGWSIVDKLRQQPNFPSNLSASIELQAAVLEIYKIQYWDVYQLDKFSSQIIANELFDTGVNAGTGTAGKFLQRTLNLLNLNQKLYADLKIDGDVGGATLIALNTRLPKEEKLIYKILNALQGGHYISIAENNPSQEEFIRSWFSRVTFA